jgi:hypothetical protein
VSPSLEVLPNVRSGSSADLRPTQAVAISPTRSNRPAPDTGPTTLECPLYAGSSPELDIYLIHEASNGAAIRRRPTKVASPRES